MIIRILLCSAMMLVISGCGFVSAPFSQSAAYVGKGLVKGADAGIHYTKKAAKSVAQTATNVGEAAAQTFKPSTDTEQTVNEALIQ